MINALYKFIRAAALVTLLLPTVQAIPQASTTQAAKSQPIRLHPANPHYFLFRGKAVALITSGEHYGAVLNRDFDYRRYLATLEADGLNYTRLFTGSYVEVPAKSFGILHNDLAPDPDLPEDTRLWAALVHASGGVWGGCVYDPDAIINALMSKANPKSEAP